MCTKEKKDQPQALVEVFNFSQERTPIRVQVINNEPWFVSKDVCDILEISNNRDAVSRLDDDEKATSVLPTQFGAKEMWLINESGLYSLIFQSRKPEAKTFRKWVTSEVLPAIRKKGYYGVYKEKTDYIDAQDTPYERKLYNDSEVRCIEIDGKEWMSISDFFMAIGNTTSVSQAVKKLNAKNTHAVKILIFGSTNPAWYVDAVGASLLVSGSRKLQGLRQLKLPF